MLQSLKNKITSLSSSKKVFLLLCVVLTLTIGAGTSLAYVMTGTPTLVNLFRNGLNPDGNLVIQKNIVHPFGDTYTLLEDLAFTFEVNLGEEYANEKVKTSQGEAQVNENGVVIVTIPANGRTTIYDIDDGTSVVVSETVKSGFTPEITAHGLEFEKLQENAVKFAIKKYQDNAVTFTNTYSPAKADTSKLTVSGQKSLVGRDWQEGDSFTFELEVNEANVWKSLGNETITYELEEQPDPANPDKTILVPKADFDKFDFSEVIQAYEFDEIGTYSFRVTEVEGTIGGLTYDKNESVLEVIVGDADMDGYLEIQSISSESANTEIKGTAVSIAFENKYAPAGSAEAVIEIQKELNDTSGQNKTPEGFTFDLYDENGEIVKSSSATTALGETSINLIFEPTDAGNTFTYTLKETNGGQTIGALSHDNTEYKIQVSVVDNLNGTVSAYIYDYQAAVGETRIPEDADDTFEAEFSNTYDPQDISVEIKGEKLLSGRELKAGEFDFKLYETDETFAIAEGAQPALTTKNNSDGTFAFASISYDKIGTHYYVVAEDDANALGGITYDSTRYLVTVVVTDNKGVLNAETTITDAYGETSDIKFVNSYKAVPVTLPLSGKKILNGAELKEGEFEFQIQIADEAFNAQEKPFQTVKNNRDGEFAFENLIFTDVGTYRYVVTEDDSAEAEGMTYDDTVYCITVVVTDSGEGQLEVSEFNMMADGQVVTEILFENTYTAPVEPEQPDEPEGPVGSDDSDKPTDDDKSEAVGTGDSNKVLLYVGMLIVSGALILLVVFGRRKKIKR